MNLDPRCLSACLFLLLLLGLTLAVPLETFQAEDWGENAGQEEAVKRGDDAGPDGWTYPLVPPRDARGRKQWRNSPYKSFRLMDDSVKTFDSRISLCGLGRVCKQAEKSTFKCRCPMYTYCVADGWQYDATCTYSQVGLVFNQPKW